MHRGCPRHGETTAPGCHRCHLYATDPRYRELWSGTERPAPPPPRKACAEMGPPLTAVRLARLGLDLTGCGCAGKVRECRLHDVCTTGVARNGIRCCATCPDHTQS